MSISSEVKLGMAHERTAVTVLDLLRIEDSNLDPYILLVNNTEDVQHREETYHAAIFTVARGGEGGAPSTSTINILDLDQTILLQLENIPSSQEEIAKTVIRFILIDPEDPELKQIEEEYELESYEVGDDGLITMTVLTDPYMSVEIPAHGFTPDIFPSIFPTIEGE